MSRNYQTAFRILALIWITLIWTVSGVAQVGVAGTLQPNGDVGFVTSPSNSIVFGVGCSSLGPDCQGSIFQMDGFVNVPNYDFGNGSGASWQLTNGAPTGIGYTFTSFQPIADQLLLTYSFVNNTSQNLPGFQFLYYADPDIGSNFADEWATVTGLPGFGLTSYQVGDPSLSS